MPTPLRTGTPQLHGHQTHGLRHHKRFAGSLMTFGWFTDGLFIKPSDACAFTQRRSRRKVNAVGDGVCEDGPRAPGLDGVLAVSASQTFAEDIPVESVTREAGGLPREPASGNPRRARTEQQAEEDTLSPSSASSPPLPPSPWGPTAADPGASQALGPREPATPRNPLFRVSLCLRRMTSENGTPC